MTKSTDEKTSHIDLSLLQNDVEKVLTKYRKESGYLGKAGLTDRDIFNLTRRLMAALSSRIEEIDTNYIEHLEGRVDELEERVELMDDPQFETLYSEFEAMRAVVKELIYRLGEEDSTLVLPNDQIQYKAEKVEMDVEVTDTTTRIELTEIT